MKKTTEQGEGANHAPTLNLMLPWPAKELNPNYKGHWAPKSRAVKGYRNTCRMLTSSEMSKAGLSKFPLNEHGISVSVIFFPPDKRKRDEDNMIASMKSAYDGIADGLGVDDNNFKYSYKFQHDMTKNGAVYIRIEPLMAGL